MLAQTHRELVVVVVDVGAETERKKVVAAGAWSGCMEEYL